MKSKLFLILTTIAILGSPLFVGCAGGVAPEEYDRVAAQLQAALSKLAEEQNKVGDIQSQKQTAEVALPRLCGVELSPFLAAYQSPSSTADNYNSNVIIVSGSVT